MQEGRDLKKEAAILADWFHVFNSDAGQRILESLEEEFSECSYEEKAPIHTTIFNEGRRALFLKIKEKVEAGRDPKKWLDEQSYIREEPDA